VLLLALAPAGCGRPADVRVGSKAFPESEILGELARDLAASTGRSAEHRGHLGDTSKVWTALLLGEIDAYCEYTGTLSHDILTDEHVRTDDEIRRALAAKDVRMSRSLGFSDNYALGMREDRAAELGIRTISDLKKHPELKLGLSHQFLDRADGWRHPMRPSIPWRTRRWPRATWTWWTSTRPTRKSASTTSACLRTTATSFRPMTRSCSTGPTWSGAPRRRCGRCCAWKGRSPPTKCST
jgi:hypothetical protein